MNHASTENRRRFLKTAVVGGAALGLSLTALASDQPQAATAAAPVFLKLEDVQSIYVSYRSSLYEDSQHLELPLGAWSGLISAHGASYRIKLDSYGTHAKYGPIFTLTVDDGSGKWLVMNLGDRATGTFPDQGLQFFIKAQARPAFNG